MWAIKSAHEAGLSIRQIASATGLSSSRVHQVVNDEEPVKIPAWVTDLGNATEGQTPNRLVAEVGSCVSASAGCTNWNAVRTLS
jgi:hypothetical protein